MEYYTLGVAARALRCKLFGKTDVGRWADVRAFETEWDERSHIIGELIPAKSRVLDFGAGRRQLSRFIDPSCTYLFSDFMDRGAGTLIIDLNARPLPDLSSWNIDVAVFAGVLEYVSRVDTLVNWLYGNTKNCVASYGCVDETNSRGMRWMKEVNKRASCGWVNSYTETKLIDIFGKAGFSCRETRDWVTRDGSERIFSFQRAASR
jgi:hypothetical protein